MTDLKIKEIILEAIAADETLVRRLVFKGGAALEIVYGIAARSSIDLDFSLEGDFDGNEMTDAETRLRAVLDSRFGVLGIEVFDLSLSPRPSAVSPELEPFWGGYRAAFKLVARTKAEMLERQIDKMRLNSIAVGPGQRKTLEIDISRHEVCPDAEFHAIGRSRLRVYSPRLIVAEKLRAICQQHAEYRRIVLGRPGHSRARDFFDIYHVIDHFSLALATPDFLTMLAGVFSAKRVPIGLLWRLEELRDLHADGFQSVLDTVSPGSVVLTFDEYFDSVLRLVRSLQALGDV